MAGHANSNGTPFQAPMYLSQNEQDLYLASLADKSDPKNAGLGLGNQNAGTDGMPYHFGGGFDSGFFPAESFNQPGAFPADQLTGFQSFPVEESPYLDVIDGTEGHFDFDIPNGGPTMFEPLPGDTTPPMLASKSQSPQANGATTPDKRKSSEVSEEPEDAKRRDGEDKTSKKPGRKPLTTEPTTKRKAQNRAAQRAFRERKEKHLRDLETKVTELEKASESANHENGLLRAQVSRLQAELREYRKRLSLGAVGLSGSPPQRGAMSSFGANSGASPTNNFSFDFPRFGALPGGSQLFLKENESARSTASPAAGNAASSGKGGDSPALNGSSTKGPNGGRADSVTDPSRVFQFNSSTSSSASPSASSQSHFGPNSSCGTSPEPIHNSPGKPLDKNLDTVNEQGYLCHAASEGEVTFCEKLNMACGNPRNPIPRSMSQSNGSGKPAATTTSAAKDSTQPRTANVNGIDWLADQNGGQFDPILFGGYRESQSAVVGDGDFTGGFFNDAFPIDLSSPFGTTATGLTPAINTATKRNPMEDIEILQNGLDDDDEVVPGEDTSKMMSCHKIWDKLQERPDFKDGSFDIDSLCTELRAKARCSENGVVIDQKDVDAALQRLPQNAGQPST